MFAPGVFPHRNIHRAERLLTAAAGIGLLALAARKTRGRGSLVGLSTAVLLRSLTGYCPAYAAAGISLNEPSSSDTRQALAGAKGAHIDREVRIATAPMDVYACWRDLAQLSRALPSSIQATQLSATDSQWTISKAGVPVVRWTARIINDEPGRLIAWKTIGEPGVVSAGSVHFEPAEDGRSTNVRVRFQYAPPLGRAGAVAADMLGQGAAITVSQALGNVKRMLEGRPNIATA